jgi:hypothetical protein
LYTANDAITNNRILGSEPIVYEFKYGSSGLNIDRPEVITMFQEVQHWCTLILIGINMPSGKIKHHESIYFSDLGKRKYGDWLVLWEISKSSDEEPYRGRFYMPVQERDKAETKLVISGLEMYEPLENQRLMCSSSTIELGVNIEDENVFYVPEQLSSHWFPVSDAAIFSGIGQNWYCYGCNITAVQNPIQIIWERRENPPSESELLESWDQYLKEHWEELVEQYNGKYVAIYENTVYDSDIDLATLANRVYSNLGYRPIFMPYIGEREGVAEFLSPE